MPIEIKYQAGDKVFWLSSGGFKEGIIKQVILTNSVSIFKRKRTLINEIQYLLWSEDYAEVYMGDNVKEDKIFTTYKAMLNYYEKQPTSK